MRTLPWRPLLAIFAVALTVPVASQAADATTGLKGEYFANETLSGTPAAERIDATVDFAWEGVSPAAGVGEHHFSVRWTGTVKPRFTERYTLTTRTDDGVRLWVDGKLVIDDWARHAVKANTVEVDLVADQAHDLRMELYEHRGRAEARLLWESASQAREIIPTERLTPPGAATTTPPPADTDTKTDEPVKDTFKEVVEKAAEVLPIIQVSGTVPTEAARLLPPPETPVAGEQFNAEPLAGEILVRRPADGALVPLEAGASLPVGTRIDARDGAVAVQTAPAEGFTRPTQDAAFEGAMFKVTQPARGKRIVGIDLAHGDFESCQASTRSSRARARAAGAGKRDKQVRRVFGKGKGKFRTKGRFAAATVRGTAWTVADTCDSTITRVQEGVVDVENLVTGRKVVVEAGERYEAKGR